MRMMTKEQDYNRIFEDNVEGITGGTFCMNCNTLLLIRKDEQEAHKARGHNLQKLDLVYRKSIFKMFDEVRTIKR